MTARPGPPPAEPPGPAVLDLVGLVVAMAGAVLALAASFLPWIRFGDVHFSYWRISKVQDVFLLVVALAIIGLSTAALIAPRTRVLRLLALGASAGLISFVLAEPIELIARSEPGISGRQAGEVAALIAAVALATAAVLLLINLRPPAGQAPERLSALLLAGLVMIGGVGLLQPLVQLLSISHGFSAWETFKAEDIVLTLIGLATAGVALSALLAPRVVPLAGVAFLLGCYLAVDHVAGSIEGLAASYRGAELFVTLLLLGPLAIAGAVLVAVGSPPLRREPG